MSGPRMLREAWWAFLWDWAAEGNREGAETRRGRPLLGEDEDGNILMPSRTRLDRWGPRRFNGRNPAHWPVYLRSRRARAMVMVEADQ